MEHVKNFANLAETLSAKFPELKDTAHFYVLAYVALEFPSDGLFFDEFKGFFYHSVFNRIYSYVLPEIEKSNLVDIKKLAKKEFNEVCNYLIQKCLASEAKNFFKPEKLLTIVKDLAELESDAIHKADLYRFSYSDLSKKAILRIADSEFSDVFHNRKEVIHTPESLENLLIEIADLQPKQQIYNPICGASSLFLSLQKKFPEYNLKCEGNEENSYLYLLGLINRWANNLSWHDYSVNKGNPLDEDRFDSLLKYQLPDEYNDYGKFDIALTILPFETQPRKNKPLAFEFFRKDGGMPNVETAYIELMLAVTNKRGKVIVVAPENFLFSRENKLFREKYLLNDWIEEIINLPEDTFKPFKVKSSIIIFNKNKSRANKGVIIFNGKSDDFEETRVKNSVVKSQDNLDLRASRYALKESKELASILLKYPQDEVKRIKDLIDSSISGYNYPPHNRIAEGSSENLPYVRVTDLSKNAKDFALDISKVKRKISHEKARKNSIIDFPAVLVCKIAPKLKPTYFNFTGQPIVIGSDVIALKMKKDVNIEYFLTQLLSRLVQIQVEMSSSGTAINRIGKEDFLNIEITLPSFEEQQRQILEMRGVIEEKAIAQEQLFLAKKEIETTEYDVIAAISHNLNQKLGKIVDDYGTLLMFLQKKEEKNSTFRFDELLRPIRVGELVESVPTFSKVVNRLQNNLLDTAETMKTTEKILQKSKVDAQETDIVEFFKKSIKPDFEGSQFSIKIESRLKSLLALVDRNAFKDAIRNLIENAKNHGFVDSDRKYQIIFEISKYTNELGEDLARIVYKNNGKPFPKDYKFEDYVRLGTRAGKNKGTGLGGFFVKKVIELHKGNFSPISLYENGFEIFPVQMEILIPLVN